MLRPCICFRLCPYRCANDRKKMISPNLNLLMKFDTTTLGCLSWICSKKKFGRSRNYLTASNKNFGNIDLRSMLHDLQIIYIRNILLTLLIGKPHLDIDNHCLNNDSYLHYSIEIWGSSFLNNKPCPILFRGRQFDTLSF